ncbi:MAG: SEL1-like repeat protein, partial [Pseudomonadota bacterium]
MKLAAAPYLVLGAGLAAALLGPSPWAHATYADALKAYQDKNWPAAFVEADLLARQGKPRGQALLAALYAQGLGVKRDLSEAVRWYTAAA